jgi:hypothetical protein
MAKKAIEKKGTDVQSAVVTAQIPDILQFVEDYTYVNHMRVVTTQYEVRIAVADVKPIGSVSKPIGLVMSHLHAKEFVSVLKRVIEKIDTSEIADGSEAKEM